MRSLARDLALACGSVGHIALLRRLRVGPFTLDQAVAQNLWQPAAADSPPNPNPLTTAVSTRRASATGGT
jgi:tRNA pseudouridine55 synthase